MLRTSCSHILENTVIDAVMLEAFLVHARNPIEFLWDHAPSGAILPKDFGGPVSRDKDPAISAIHTEISQLLSHLTWDRVQIHEPHAEGWPHVRVQQFREALRLKAEAFFVGLPPNRRAWFVHDAFPNEYQHWCP